MDDPWSNAWSDPHEPHKPPAKSSKQNDDNFLWTVPADVVRVKEDDIGIPSWALGGTNWNEASGSKALWTTTTDESALDGWKSTANTAPAQSDADTYEAPTSPLSPKVSAINPIESEDTTDVHESKDIASHSPSLWRDATDKSITDGWKQSMDMVPAHLDASSHDSPTRPLAPEGSTAVAIETEDPAEDETVDSPLEALPPIPSSPLSPSHQLEVEAPTSPTQQSPPHSPPSDLFPRHVPPPLESADAFGTFESGIESDLPSGAADSWASPVHGFDADGADSNNWDTAWTHGDKVAVEEEQPKDEWEIAREQRYKRDRRVPPAVIASIMDHWDELSAHLWPEEAPQEGKKAPKAWVEDMEGLPPMADGFLPESPFHPPIQFVKTVTAKSMANSVKLSKHLPIVKSSPMSHLFAARGSSAWELSVKNRVDVVKDDLPVGWRAVEPQPAVESKSVVEKKAGGGFLSFWGRRPSSVSSVVEPQKEAVPAPAPLPEPEVSPNPSVASGSARQSLDRSHSPASSIKGSIEAELTTKSVIPPPASAALPPPTSTSAPPKDAESPLPAAPSVVSRFLNRFSRTRSVERPKSSSPRSSIALSSDDLEFLSDIIPSAADDVSEGDQLKGLTSMISSSPLPTKLPPPLAPPPRSPLTSQPPIHQGVISNRPETKPAANYLSDLEGFLDHASSTGLSRINTKVISTSSTSQVPALLPPPPSPIASMIPSKPSTPSPLTGRPSLEARRQQQTNVATMGSPRSGGFNDLDSAFPVDAPSRSQTPLAPKPIPHPPTSNFRSQSPAIKPFLQPSILPPPPSIPQHNLVTSITTASSDTAFDDDDEFSPFHSSSLDKQADSMQQISSLDTSFDSSSNQLLSSASELDSSFGDFADFDSPPLGSPSPPLPPLKSSPPSRKIPVTHIRKPSRADHQLTIDLMEKAAARPGRWPSPPSPLPDALAPPTKQPESTTDQTNDGFFDNFKKSTPGGISLKPISELNMSLFSSEPLSRPVSAQSRSTPTLSPPPSTTPSSTGHSSFSIPPPPPPASSTRAQPVRTAIPPSASSQSLDLLSSAPARYPSDTSLLSRSSFTPPLAQPSTRNMQPGISLTSPSDSTDMLSPLATHTPQTHFKLSPPLPSSLPPPVSSPYTIPPPRAGAVVSAPPTRPIIPTVPSSASTQKGGLSAQDLSFFEGL